MSVVTEHLERQGVAFEVIPHPRAMTSLDEAGALGIAADEVVKTLVLDTTSGHALAVLLATRRLDTKRAREAVADRHARLASEDELTRDFPGFELGALPPLGSLLAIPVYVDPAVIARETVVFAAGSQTESVRVRTADLLRSESCTVAALCDAPPP